MSSITKRNAGNAHEGRSLSEQARAAAARGLDSMKQLSAAIFEIAAASDQQSHGIDQINNAVGQMNLVTQEVAANAEESAGASQGLSSQAAEMQGMVVAFKLSTSREAAAARRNDPVRKPPIQSSNPIRTANGKSVRHSRSKCVIPLDEDRVVTNFCGEGRRKTPVLHHSQKEFLFREDTTQHPDPWEESASPSRCEMKSSRFKSTRRSRLWG